MTPSLLLLRKYTKHAKQKYHESNIFFVHHAVGKGFDLVFILSYLTLYDRIDRRRVSWFFKI